jgi:hypothetical protein
MISTRYVCLVLIILALVVVIPVSATTINLSIISTPSDISTTSIDAYTCTGDVSNPCTYSVPSGGSIYESSFSTATPGVYYITYYFADGTSVSATYIYESTSLFSGTLTEWMGSNHRVDSYYTVPGIPVIWCNLPSMNLGVDQGSGIYYMVTSIDLIQPYESGTLYNFDDANSAYAILGSSPAVNPIISYNAYTLTGGTFNNWVESESVSTMSTAITKAKETETTWLDTLGLGNVQKVLNVIIDGLNALAAITTSVAALLSALLTVSTLIFASGMFVGLNALYIAFAIILAIEDSDDIFRSFGSFMRRMNKLLNFYMKLYTSIKKIILAWT